MLEFGSSRAAVEAAFALAEQREPKVGVGVHLGDVAVQSNVSNLERAERFVADQRAASWEARTGLESDETFGVDGVRANRTEAE